MPLLQKKKASIVQKVIVAWKDEGVINESEAEKLSNSIQVMYFDWKKLAKYCFWFAIASLVISLFAALSDIFIIKLLKQLFDIPAIAKSIFFLLFSGMFYYLGYRRKKLKPTMFYSIEAIFLLGVITTAIGIAFFGQAIDTGSGHFSLLILLSCIVYGAVGFLVRSILIWVFALLSLGSWFGAETGYMSGWGAYYLGMNYPIRFVLFGFVLTVVSHILQKSKQTAFLYHPTFTMGLLYTFIALWIMSIFGNYTNMHIWREAKQIELFHFSLLFALASAAAIYYGLKFDNQTARGFGITFLFINLYTRYFEFFWDATHKAFFFGILGLSLWYLGIKAEKIYSLGKHKAIE